MHFGILGAGVVGLNTGLELQKEFPNAQVTIVADKFEEETLSFGAGGIFRPGTSFSGPSDEITKKWIVDSYNFYDEILQSQEASDAGVLQVSGYTFSARNQSLTTRNSFLEGLLPVYRAATEDELHLCPGDWKYGSYMTTLVIDQTCFLPWAKLRFEAAGGQLRRRKVNKLSEFGDPAFVHSASIREPFDAVFNCSGLASQWLCNDRKLVPVRGQVFKVKAPWIKMFFYHDFDTYVIPGRNFVTLGGTRQLESYNESIDPNDSKGIWDRCTSLMPTLHKATVVKEWVGLRPYRSEVRCELEEIKDDRNNILKVIHQYGHGGYGVTSSPGSAKYSVQLLRNSLRGSSSYNSRSKL